MNIAELLDRYFEGNTTLEEERNLKAYFLSGEVAAEHKAYEDLFVFFKEEGEISFEGVDSIDLILEKYFEGETSIEEEQRLKTYFVSGNIIPEHEVYKDLFTFFTEEAEVTFDAEDRTDVLLEKYFAGETSIEEEQRLKRYFNEGDIAEEHKEFAELFGYFSLAQTEELEKNIDLKRGRTLHIVRRTMIGIAATLTILLGSLYVMNLNQQPSVEDPIELSALEEQEAEEALQQTMEALAYLGVQFNKGTESLEQMKNLKKTEIFKN